MASESASTSTATGVGSTSAPTIREIITTNQNPQIWKYFNLCIMTDNSQKAQCKHCFHFLSVSSNTTLRNHITHPHCEAKKAQQNQNPEAGQTSMARDESVFSEYERYVNSDFVTHLHPKEFATFDVLGFWKEKETMYPVLSRMAMDIISVQASSVASESAFSTSGRVLSIRRTRLTPASLEMCMCLKDHLDAKERKQDKSPLEIPLDFEEDVLDDEVQRNEAIPLSDEEIALDASSEGTLSPGGPRRLKCISPTQNDSTFPEPSSTLPDASSTPPTECDFATLFQGGAGRIEDGYRLHIFQAGADGMVNNRNYLRGVGTMQKWTAMETARNSALFLTPTLNGHVQNFNTGSQHIFTPTNDLLRNITPLYHTSTSSNQSNGNGRQWNENATPSTTIPLAGSTRLPSVITAIPTNPSHNSSFKCNKRQPNHRQRVTQPGTKTPRRSRRTAIQDVPRKTFKENEGVPHTEFLTNSTVIRSDLEQGRSYGRLQTRVKHTERARSIDIQIAKLEAQLTESATDRTKATETISSLQEALKSLLTRDVGRKGKFVFNSKTRALCKLSCLLEAARQSLTCIRLCLRGQSCLHAPSNGCTSDACVIRTSYVNRQCISCDGDNALSPAGITLCLLKRLTAPYLMRRLAAPYLLRRLAAPCLLRRLAAPYLPRRLAAPYLLRRLASPYLLRRHYSLVIASGPEVAFGVVLS
ncbi:zinc finger BED domain-containing protein RICESLEEPER 2 [Tanacetum coccineum]